MTQIDMEKFRMEFLEEAADLLENANESILKAESEGDAELFNAVFRNIHTIKGSAGGFGFDNMSEFAHHLESLLDKLRNGEIKIDGDITDLLLKGVDILFEMIQYARDKRPYDRNLSDIIAMYEATNGEEHEEVQKTETVVKNLPSAAADITEHLRLNDPGFGKAYKIQVNFTDDMLENGYDPQTLLANLKEISEYYLAVTDTSKISELSALEPYKLCLRPEIYIISDAATEEIADLAFDPDLITITEISLKEQAAPVQEEPEAQVQAEEFSEAEPDVDTVNTSGIQYEMLAELASGIEDYFESIENFLIDIEKTGEGKKDAVDNIFRVFHNIKGDCGYVGFTFLEKYAHLVENMLDKVRSGSIVFDRKAAEFILNVISDVKALVKSLLNNTTPELPKTYRQLQNLQESMLTLEEKVPAVTGDVKIFLAQVDQFFEIISLAKADGNNAGMLKRAAMGFSNAAKFIGFTDLMEIAHKFADKAGAGADFSSELTQIEHYIKDLKSPAKKLGELLIESGKVTAKEIEEAKAQQKKIGEILVNQGKLEPKDLEIALKKQVIMKATTSVPESDSSSISLASALTKEEQEEKGDTSKEKYSQSMKVDQEKIDKFTNTIGELVVAKNAYEYMMQRLIREFDLPTSLIKDFKDNSNLISRISQDLQRDIMSLRMVPIKQIFNKFPRVVRDIARKQNKQIDLRIIGEDTEIDKKIADILSDPLVHLVRNSCDHGIESPEERSKASKPEEGQLILKAYNEGSFVYIEVIDDGRGMDPKKILAKAIQKGLAPDDAVLSDNEIIQFILAPGFSTAEQVTDISGRGVGMDVVKSSITSVGGTIDVQSSLGDGSRMVMKIPVTIGMSTSLLVRMKPDEHYAFPIENVAETIKVAKEQVKDLHFGNGIYYRGNVLPLIQLSKLLGDEEKELADEVNIVITVTDEGKTGIIVDELLNRMDIAIKPVPEYFAHLNYIGGVTILGDGQAVLVLNVNKLL
ncbi:chemotaxis protein CheA [Seleniivibrio sp.]|uniref:chemotaxis protein CheA n=1 Tax=Seleniivibrio sp. TaxID=2898801 RepID=UPI0025F56C2B|nr:chemotaxis protein CheA [Seleniivibrio sp.]MCD8554454.1 Hpt domain-containing protein [Seleniivibrio sp.]